jgi:Mn2+/Fe2+ NRAMP family transporter
MPPPHTISRSCPKCGASSYDTVRPDRPGTFSKDRVCKACGTRYSPPTSMWAAILLICGGLFTLTISGLLCYIALHLTSNVFLLLGAPLLFVGIVMIVSGLRRIKQEENKAVAESSKPRRG